MKNDKVKFRNKSWFNVPGSLNHEPDDPKGQFFRQQFIHVALNCEL